MKTAQFILLSLLLNISVYSFAEGIKCPVSGPGANVTKDQVYAAIKPNLVWQRGDSNAPIAFVDKTDLGSDENKGNYEHWNGVFKIAYDYKARECRRQILLDDKSKDGVFTGWLAVEVCNPDLPTAAIPTKLPIAAGQEEAVKYIYDANKQLTRRFKTKIDQLYFTKTGDICKLDIIMNSKVNRFAGIIPSYPFIFQDKNTYSGELFYYDSKGISVVGAKYTNTP